MALHRRRLLELCGTTVAAGIAGCLGDSTAPGDDGSGNGTNDDSGPLRGDAVVDYPGIVDGEATVSADEREITYEDPEAVFTAQYAYEGDTDSPSQLRVNRDLSGETMAAFVAPVYDEDAGAFAYHVFANEAFVSFSDWYYVAGPANDPVETGAAAFESLGSGVSRLVIGPLEARTAGVLDVSPEEARDGSSEITGVILSGGSGGGGGSPPDVPQVAWGFEYDPESDRLTVQHEGGDNVEASQLDIRSDADLTVESGFEGTVAAGDTATVSVSADAVVRVIWTAEGGDSSAVLGEWQGPEA
ncbi:hypothetical protein [Natronomonas amylolytica]|uniref:hypothetical protein n=1 Tax=Natronomonas amylolytica TaxID=3108498 RepID=UPI00300A7309